MLVRSLVAGITFRIRAGRTLDRDFSPLVQTMGARYFSESFQIDTKIEAAIKALALCVIKCYFFLNFS